MKLGLYLATHNNPMFLRLALLQLEAQTLKPDVLAIHENGHPFQTADLINGDVLRRLASKGTQVLYDHTDAGLSHPYFHYLPLKRLVDSGRCDLYTKWDHDDIFYECHLQELVSEMGDWNYARVDGDGVWYPGYQWVGKIRADVLVLNYKKYVFKQNRPFTWNPLGGMSDTFMFNTEVAKQYLEDMAERAGTKEADDWILHKYTLPKFVGMMSNEMPTTCYVSHGRNDSTAHWVTKPPDDLR